MTIFERLKEWAEEFFSRDNIEVLADDIEKIVEVVGADLTKAQAFLAVLQGAIDKIQGKIDAPAAAAQANTVVAALDSEAGDTAKTA